MNNEISINEFKGLGYKDFCPIYDVYGNLIDIEIYNDINKIYISNNGSYKEIKEKDEDDYEYISTKPLSYREMKAVCSFMKKYKLI